MPLRHNNGLILQDQHIMITGASSGIGRATAVVASQYGARLLLAGRNEQQLDSTLSLCAENDHQILPSDLTDTDSICKWLKTCCQEHGPLSGIVHSAGLHELRPVQFVKPEHVEKILAVNLQAAIQLARGLRQKNCHTEPASLVFLSSVMALTGQAGTVAYAASKGAITAATRTLALELAPQKIRVNAVAPGTVKTEMTKKLLESLPDSQVQKILDMHPLGLGEPEDIAEAIVFLLSDHARWITGTTLVIDGGYTAH